MKLDGSLQQTAGSVVVAWRAVWDFGWAHGGRELELEPELELELGANSLAGCRAGRQSFQKSLDPESWVGGGLLAQALSLPIIPRPSVTHVFSIITCPLRPGPTRPLLNLD